MTNQTGFGGEFDYLDESPLDDAFVESDAYNDTHYKQEVRDNLIEQIREYLTFSSMGDLIKLINEVN